MGGAGWSMFDILGNLRAVDIAEDGYLELEVPAMSASFFNGTHANCMCSPVPDCEVGIFVFLIAALILVGLVCCCVCARYVWLRRRRHCKVDVRSIQSTTSELGPSDG